MPKRRLTNKQRKQIATRQQNKLKSDSIIPSTEVKINSSDRFEALVMSNYGVELEVRAKQDLSKPIYCRKRSNIIAPVAGDTAIVEKTSQGDFIVVAVKPRYTVLEKLSSANKLKPVAANVTQVFIVLALVPQPNFYILDKYIVTIKHYNIDLTIVLNKIDLITNDENHKEIIERLKVYEKIGYKVIQASTVASPWVDDIKKIANQKTSVFVGDSGVGKSSLVNMMLSRNENKTGELSSNKGIHTTSVASLSFVDSFSYIIDTPGIRELNAKFLTTDDILSGFIEFQSYIGSCKYRNCKHCEGSQGCALQQAKDQELITAERLQNYLSIIEELNQNKK